MKRAWDPVVLTCGSWGGEPPVPGDGLRTPSGRMYLINEVRGRRLHCTVLPAGDNQIAGTIHEWVWAPRSPRLRNRPPLISVRRG